MVDRNESGKFIKKQTQVSLDVQAEDLDKSNDCEEKKLTIIIEQLEKSKTTLEWWQKELIEAPHKDRNEISQIVSHYSYEVSQLQQMLFDYLNRCN